MTYLISTGNIIDTCKLGQNVDERKLEAGREAAHLRLEKIMGRTGYAQLIAAVAADTDLSDSGNATWLALMNNYITAYLAWTSFYLSVLPLHSEPTKTGYHVKSGTDYSSVDSRTLGMHENRAKEFMEMYRERVIDHLVDNTTTYTWYSLNVDREERIRQTRSDGGIIMRRSRWQDHYGQPDQKTGLDKEHV